MDLKVKDPPTNHLNSGWEDNSTRFRKHDRPTKCTGSKDRYDMMDSSRWSHKSKNDSERQPICYHISSSRNYNYSRNKKDNQQLNNSTDYKEFKSYNQNQGRRNTHIIVTLNQYPIMKTLNRKI